MHRVNLDINDLEYAEVCLKEIGIFDRVKLTLDIVETDWYNQVYTLSGSMKDLKKYIKLSYAHSNSEATELIKTIEKIV